MVFGTEQDVGYRASRDLPRVERGRVRPFVEEDISQVADLHRRVFRTGDHLTSQMQKSYWSYFREIFLNNPWYDEKLSSLVYQDADGAIVGFLGVMPRWLSFRGRSIRAAISSQFIVEPRRRFTLAAVQLMKVFLSGPQDLSIADEASDTSRRLLERAGGVTVSLYSLYWGRLLRPSQYFLSRLGRQQGLPAPVVLAAQPVSRFLDWLAARMPGSPFRQTPPEVFGGELDTQTLLACMSEFSRDRSVRPEYDDRSLKWLLGILEQKTEHGTFQKVAVRNTAGDLIGWYLYYLNRGGIGEVLQVGARGNAIKDVLDHLSYHAWQQGVLALSGRLEPRFLQELSNSSCVFHHRGLWVVVHAREPELLESFYRGEAFLTRLEGEWCIRFK